MPKRSIAAAEAPLAAVNPPRWAAMHWTGRRQRGRRMPPARLILAAAAMVALALPAIAQAPADVLPEGPGKAVLLGACTSCHDAGFVTAKKRSADDWDAVIGTMMDRGASLTEADQEALLAYLTQNFGTEPAAGPKTSD
jgi:cytochrome c5